ncbi:SGNH/GDSL hydrolase family protein [Nocardia panacis]|uniref:SGNH/GDSL hydrolase family protein n=1 Tax=Nocardia panacis TaxID=2340916 RepID=UPI001939AE97|nr:SGNH/GDSL hydrolase family protein [Nocardia panacis]
MIRRSVWAAVTGLSAIFASGQALSSAPATAEAAGGIYVALGESGAAGPFIPNQLAPLGCFRSDHNYAHLTAAALGLTLRDATCSGARIANMYAPQQIPFDGPDTPQLDTLSEDVSVVTVDIGINDYVSDGWTRSELEPKYAALLDDIRARAPHATIYVMGKIERIRAGGCFPSVPLPPDDADRIYQGVLDVNATSAAQAAAHGAIYVDTYTPSVGLDACAPANVRWAEGVIPQAPAQPLHANAVGYANEALILEATIRAHG